MTMEKRKRMRMMELLVGTAMAGLVTMGLLKIAEPNSDIKHLRGSDFKGVEWIKSYNNDPEEVRNYFEGENIPHGDTDYYLYKMTVRQRNGNPKSLEGMIEVPDLDRNGIVIGYQTPRP